MPIGICILLAIDFWRNIKRHNGKSSGDLSAGEKDERLYGLISAEGLLQWLRLTLSILTFRLAFFCFCGEWNKD